MPSIKEGVTQISKEIENTIQKKIQTILEEAEQKKEQILEEARQKADIEIQKINTETEKIIKKEKHRTDSLIRLETRRNMMNLKDKLIKEVFQKLDEKLSEFIQTEQYMDLLYDFIVQGIEEILKIINKQEIHSNISLLIGLNQVDKGRIPNDWLKNLENKFKINLKLDNPIKTIGGVRIKTQNGAISFDNTLEGRISRKKMELRMNIASILFHEVK